MVLQTLRLVQVNRPSSLDKPHVYHPDPTKRHKRHSADAPTAPFSLLSTISDLSNNHVYETTTHFTLPQRSPATHLREAAVTGSLVAQPALYDWLPGPGYCTSRRATARRNTGRHTMSRLHADAHQPRPRCEQDGPRNRVSVSTDAESTTQTATSQAEHGNQPLSTLLALPIKLT